MPNHVTNRITAPPHVLASLRGKDKDVDFEIIKPVPDDIHAGGVDTHIESIAQLSLGLIDVNADDMLSRMQASNAMRSIEEGNMAAKLDDRQFEVFVLFMRSYRKYGVIHGIDWNIEKWGTKWNAYDIEVSDGYVQFDTAWGAPHPVVEDLSKMHPSDEILHEWADEDTGSNVGRRIYRQSFREHTDLATTNAGFELAFKLKPSTAEYFTLVNGSYEYVEEE